MAERAIDEVLKYVELQRRLLAALSENDSRTHDTSRDRTGELELDDGRWTYRRHGGGVAFKDIGTGRTVDVHTGLERPDCFDAWRLRIYFGSLRRRGVKLLERETGLVGRPMDVAIDELLGRWLAAGMIVEEGECYRFSVRIVGS